jgi:hypothetical protein
MRDFGTVRRYAGVFAEDGHVPQQAPVRLIDPVLVESFCLIVK